MTNEEITALLDAYDDAVLGAYDGPEHQQPMWKSESQRIRAQITKLLRSSHFVEPVTIHAETLITDHEGEAYPKGSVGASEGLCMVCNAAMDRHDKTIQ